MRNLPAPRDSRRSLVLSVLACVVALVASCTGHIDGPPGDAPPGAGPTVGTPSPGCPAGQALCGDRCVDPSTDPAHCGSCSSACPPGLACDGAACKRLCAQGDVPCGGACTTVASDNASCGACGNACPGGQLCSGGMCGTTCAFQTCETDHGFECADTSTNPKHCGACNAACQPGLSCVTGVCQLVCPSGRASCAGTCVATATDSSHCGTCDTVCPAGQGCVSGSCGCPSGQGLCGGACVDLASNASSCGACGRVCGSGAACVAGQCVCASGTTSCGGVCSNLAADPAHCGDCARACAGGEICDQGTCKPSSGGCSAALTLCGASCVDTATSAAHCGSCTTTCPTAQICAGGVCQCPGGGTACGASCVYTQTDGANCGTCGTACASGQTCIAGACQCPAGQAFCGGACVDTQSSVTHCGGCGQPCDGGRSCTLGTCGCAGGQAFCSGACVDTTIDSDHCGGCGAACSGGAVCTASACTCPGGQTLCSSACVDLQTSLTSCGACGQACASTEVCTGGRCQGPLGADGCSGSARGLTVTEVAIYQSIKIPIMTSGQAVDPPARIADVVQGRDTMLRVFSTEAPGFSARELSARLTVTSGGVQDQYFAKRAVSVSSTDADLSTTFQIFLPEDKVQADTTYSVEVVECGASTGTVEVPRFPASGETPLGARRTGPLKITVVPVQTNSRAPDTSTTALGTYRGLMMAMYPTSDVQLSVGAGITTGYPIDWPGLLDQIRAKRQADAPAADQYYYGLVKPEDTLRVYCQSACTAGIGYVAGANQAGTRAAVGLAFADETSAKTMAHEVGHNHGRNHAPCAPGSISGVDASYPYAGGITNVWGYDSRSRVLLDPARTTDIMGYCSTKWLSDYTYNGLTDRVATVNGAFEQLVLPEVVLAYRVLLLDSRGPRWGAPFVRPDVPYGVPEAAEMLDAAGNVVASVTVYRTEISDLVAWTVLVPEPKPGAFAVRVAGWPALPFGAPVRVVP